MEQFNAAHAVHRVAERGQELAAGEKLVPVSASIAAVLAALAMLLANHSSVRALSRKNEAILYQSKAADQYNHYEARRIRAQMGQSLIDSGIVAAPNRPRLQGLLDRENALAQGVLAKAQTLDAQSDADLAASEKFMRSYESFGVAATLFEVSVVIISITALMRPKVLLVVAAAASLTGLGFLVAGGLL